MSAGRQDLAEGALGVALLHIQRDDSERARACITSAIADGVSTGANASLYHGAPALEFVLRCAGRDNPAVAQQVDQIVIRRLTVARRRYRVGLDAGVDLADFDLIRGLTGLGALLLFRGSPSDLLTDVLSYLVELAKPRPDGLPGWWCASGPDHDPAEGGHSNNGMAHGITGPLALLSLAARAGAIVDEQLGAIQVCDSWLKEHGGFYWTTASHVRDPSPPPRARPSWCYGALGVARARQLAAIALGDAARCQAAEKDALAALNDPHTVGRITDAGLCHGWAGLLTVAKVLAADSAEPGRFDAACAELEQELIARLDGLDKPGFLEGRAGAELAMAGPDTTGWTRALLIT
jgi:lantibiotic biosynthesis protein